MICIDFLINSTQLRSLETSINVESYKIDPRRRVARNPGVDRPKVRCPAIECRGSYTQLVPAPRNRIIPITRLCWHNNSVCHASYALYIASCERSHAHRRRATTMPHKAAALAEGRRRDAARLFLRNGEQNFDLDTDFYRCK